MKRFSFQRFIVYFVLAVMILAIWAMGAIQGETLYELQAYLRHRFPSSEDRERTIVVEHGSRLNYYLSFRQGTLPPKEGQPTPAEALEGLRAIPQEEFKLESSMSDLNGVNHYLERALKANDYPLLELLAGEKINLSQGIVCERTLVWTLKHNRSVITARSMMTLFARSERCRERTLLALACEGDMTQLEQVMSLGPAHFKMRNSEGQSLAEIASRCGKPKLALELVRMGSPMNPESGS